MIINKLKKRYVNTHIDTPLTNTYTMSVDVFDSYPLFVAKENDGSGHFYVNMEDTYIGQYPTANLFMTDSAPVFTSITTTVSSETTLSIDHTAHS